MFKEIFDYIDKNIGSLDNENTENIDSEEILKISYNFCENLTISYKKIVHRVCGQSGSGKTTQLCSALLETYNNSEIKPIVIAVRSFAKLHPNYDVLLSEFGENLIREKTNVFALKCLFATIKLLAEKGAFFILDLTILDPIFEQFINNLFKEYKVYYHIIAVSKKISDSFIKKRELSKTGFEAGRIIFKSSSDYFYKILPTGLKYIAKKYPKTNCIIWNVFDKQPCFVGKINTCIDAFMKNKSSIKEFLHSEEQLRKSKIDFYNKYLFL